MTIRALAQDRMEELPIHYWTRQLQMFPGFPREELWLKSSLWCFYQRWSLARLKEDGSFQMENNQWAKWLQSHCITTVKNDFFSQVASFAHVTLSLSQTLQAGHVTDSFLIHSEIQIWLITLVRCQMFQEKEAQKQFQGVENVVLSCSQ